MKNPFLLLLLTFSMAFSQDEMPQYANVLSRFAALYNAQDYQGIYELYDVNIKKALTPEENRQFFTENVNRIKGSIKEWEFVGYRRGAHVYRTIFDRALADVIISLNAQDDKISKFYISPPEPLGVPILERNTTKMIIPLKEEVFVYWGGITLEQNIHVKEITQQYAYDLLMVRNGAPYEGDPKINENYFIFDKEIIAPCDARVVLVVNGIKDNIPGDVNPDQLAGNHIVLQTSNEEFLVLAHLKEDSIVVEVGQDVLQGEVLALCGNSGNSTEPHLHLSLQNTLDEEEGIGAKLFFDQIMVNGEIKSDYLPVKEEFIRNLE